MIFNYLNVLCIFNIIYTPLNDFLIQDLYFIKHIV